MPHNDTAPEATYTDRVLGDLRAALGRRSMTQRQLAASMKRSPDWVSDRIGRVARTGITTRDLEEFARVLDLDVETIGRSQA